MTRRGVVACSLAGAGAPDHDAPSEPHRKQMEIDSSRPKSVLADLHSVAQPRTDNRVAKTAAAVALGSASLLAAHATLPPAVPCVGVGVARAGTFSHQKDHTLGDVLYYRFQNIFALPLPGKILCLVAFTVPVVFAGAVAYKVVDALNAKLEPAGGDDSNEPESWTDALANSFYLLNNVPGADATTDEWDTPGGARRGFVTQCIVFIGLFVFAIIIGIISDEITAQVEAAKTGNNKVDRKRSHRHRQLEQPAAAAAEADGGGEIGTRGDVRPPGGAPRGRGQGDDGRGHRRGARGERRRCGW